MSLLESSWSWNVWLCSHLVLCRPPVLLFSNHLHTLGSRKFSSSYVWKGRNSSSKVFTPLLCCCNYKNYEMFISPLQHCSPSTSLTRCFVVKHCIVLFYCVVVIISIHCKFVACNCFNHSLFSFAAPLVSKDYSDLSVIARVDASGQKILMNCNKSYVNKINIPSRPHCSQLFSFNDMGGRDYLLLERKK